MDKFIVGTVRELNERLKIESDKEAGFSADVEAVLNKLDKQGYDLAIIAETRFVFKRRR